MEQGSTRDSRMDATLTASTHGSAAASPAASSNRPP